MKAIDRLYIYLDNQGIKPTKFEREIGFSSGYLSNMRKRNADMGETLLNKVIEYCHLSADWLLTGTGTMHPKESYNELKQTSGDPPECDRCRDKDAVIAAQRAQIESQTELLDLLKQARPLNDGQKRKTA